MESANGRFPPRIHRDDVYNHIDVQIGKSIRVLREEQALSAAAFARGIDVSVSQLEEYEAGAARLPAKAMMEAALLLHVDASAFFAGLPLSQPENRACPVADERAPTPRTGRARRG
ncbi:MAG: helix-turn-helix domain-containing protein [Rhizobiaceae bacterium]